MYYIIRGNGIVRKAARRNVFVRRILCAMALCAVAFMHNVATPSPQILAPLLGVAVYKIILN